MELKRFQFILLRTVLILSIFLTVHSHSSFAENYTQMNLPDGAIARLGIGEIQDLLYSPDGKVLAVASTIGIWLYDTDTYQEIKLLPIPLDNSYYSLGDELKKTTFSVDGQTLVGETEHLLRQLILIWNVNTEECKIVEIGDRVYFSPDRQKLTINQDKTIELWQAANDKVKKPLNEADDDEKEKVKIALNPDGKTYATTDDQYGISIRNIRTHKQKSRITSLLYPIYPGEIILSPNGKLLVMLEYKLPIYVWDINTGKLQFRLKGHRMTRLHEHKNYDQPFVFEGVAFSPDGKTLVCGSIDGPIRLWDLNNGKLTKKLNGHKSFVNSIVFSRDGKFLATGSDDGSILVWNTETWEHVPFHDERLFSVSCLSYNRGWEFACSWQSNR